MFNGLTRNSFNVDLLIPAIQTAATFVAAQILGRLGQYTMSNQTALLVSGVASVVASFASNFFNKACLYYAAIPIGIGTGLATHMFFYPTRAFNQVLDTKGILIIAAVLVSVKLIADNLSFLRRQEQKIEENILDVEENILDEAEKVIKEGKEHVENKKEELKEVEE